MGGSGHPADAAGLTRHHDRMTSRVGPAASGVRVGVRVAWGWLAGLLTLATVVGLAWSNASVPSPEEGVLSSRVLYLSALSAAPIALAAWQLAGVDRDGPVVVWAVPITVGLYVGALAAMLAFVPESVIRCAGRGAYGLPGGAACTPAAVVRVQVALEALALYAAFGLLVLAGRGLRRRRSDA